MADWPVGLDFFEAASGSTLASDESAVIRTQMDAGPAKTRLRSNAGPMTFNAISRQWTQAELDTFETWFRDTVFMGSISFNAPDPFSGTTKVFKFIGGYRITPGGNLHTVSATLERYP